MSLINSGIGRWLVVLVSLLVGSVSGCATAPPTPDELTRADYGSSISQEEAIAKATAFLKTHLKDPDSARIEWQPLEKAWMREAPIHGGTLRFGYILNANINAKNSFGAYVGYKPYRFLFFNGTLVSAYAQQELRGSYGGTPYMGKIY